MTTEAPAPVVSTNPENLDMSPAAVAERTFIEERDKIMKAAEDRIKRLQAATQATVAEAVLADKRGEMISETHDFLVGLFGNLGIAVPASGLTLNWKIEASPGLNGAASISITNIASDAPKTRKPRGTGTTSSVDSRWAFNAETVEGFTGEYKVGEAIIKSAAKVLKDFGYNTEGDAATRHIAKFVEMQPENAAKVLVHIADEWISLPDAVGLFAPSKEAVVEAPAEATEAPAAPAPVA